MGREKGWCGVAARRGGGRLLAVVCEEIIVGVGIDGGKKEGRGEERRGDGKGLGMGMV